MLFENSVTDNKIEFLQKVQEVSDAIEIPADWLMAVMELESGINPKQTNSIGAVGLIQFIPQTYEAWGYTKQDLLSMSNLEQLDLVYKFYKSFKGKIKSFYDLSICAFFPAVVYGGYEDSTIFQAPGLTAFNVANNNKPADLNNDNTITVAEYKEFVNNRLRQKGIDPSIFDTTNNEDKSKKTKIFFYSFIAFFVLIFLILIYRYIYHYGNY